MKDLSFLEAIKNVPKAYRPVAFWFLNHCLREDELRRQIREMADKGFGGIMCHARDGLRSGYLDDAWRQALAWCIDEAAQLGLDVWLYDELNYPTGPAGGRMFDRMPGSRMQSLEWLASPEVSPGAAAGLETGGRVIRYAWSQTANGALQPVCLGAAANWINPAKRPARLMLLVEERDLAEAYRFPDPLDPGATEAFVDLSYEWYARAFGRYFGSVIKGEFTDNSCFNFGLARRAMPWTPDLPERFARKIGRALADVLPGLFINTPSCKQDRLLFWKFIGDEYLESFVMPIDRSCRKNNIVSTGHYCLEMAGAEHIRQLGDRFDQKRHQGLPGVDMLGTDDLAQMDDLLRMPGRDALSVAIPGTSCAAYFFQNSRVMCECLGLAGGWALDLGEIRRVTGLLAVLGIDLFVPHGLYYSIAGHRKRECGPDHLHNPMWRFYREWTDWIARLSYVSSHAVRTSQTALLYPATTQRAYVELGARPTAGAAPKASDRGPVCDLVDFTWMAAGNALLENNIAYEIIDEKLIQSARIEGAALHVPAANGTDMAFTVLVLPCARILEAKTVAVLQQWQAASGVLVMLNSAVEECYDPEENRLAPLPADLLPADCRLDFVSEPDLAGQAPSWMEFLRRQAPQPVAVAHGQGKIVSRHWRKWDCDFYLFHNVSRAPVPGVGLTVAGDYRPCRIDLETGGLADVAGRRENGRFVFQWDFAPAQALLLMAGAGLPTVRLRAPLGRPESAVIAVEGPWAMRPLSPNVLPLRVCGLENRGSVRRYVYTFEIADVPGCLGVTVDCEMKDRELRLDRYLASHLKCCLNGVDIESMVSRPEPARRAWAGWAPKLMQNLRPGRVFDRWLFEADVTALVRPGLNEWVVEIATGILDENRAGEVPLLFGPFIVEDVQGRERITAARYPHQQLLGDWRSCGYPYYAGMMAYHKRIRAPGVSGGRDRMLSLGEVANAAEVLVNGRLVGRKVLPPWEFTLSAAASADELDIEVRVANTPQNLWDVNTRPAGLFGPVSIRAV